jgi:hypothetical protein
MRAADVEVVVPVKTVVSGLLHAGGVKKMLFTVKRRRS